MIATFKNPLVGNYVVREFKSGLFTGKVVGLIHAYGSRLCRVIYSDGDIEDISEVDVIENSPLCSPRRKEKLNIELAVNRWHNYRTSSGDKVDFVFQSQQNCPVNLPALKISITRGNLTGSPSLITSGRCYRIETFE